MITHSARVLLLLGCTIPSYTLARLLASDTAPASRLEDLEDDLTLKDKPASGAYSSPGDLYEEKHDLNFQDTFDIQATTNKNHIVHGRELVQCGEVYQMFSIEEVQALVQGYISTMPVGPDEIAMTMEGILSQLRFGVQFRKICASCDSIIQDGDVDESMLSDENFLKYCGEDAYGSDTLHSGTVMFPMTLGDDGSYSIIRAKDELQSWMQFRPLVVSNIDSNFLSTTPVTPHFFNRLITSSAGLVSFSFHLSGYDISNSLVPSPLNRNSIVTASLPIFYKARSMLLQETDDISYLGNEAYFAGPSEGGHASISAADSLKSFGIEPIHVFASGAPIKVRSEGFLGFMRSVLGGTLGDVLQILVVMVVGVPLSNTRPGVANYGSGQYGLSEDVINDAVDLFSSQLVPSASLDPSSYGLYLATNYPVIFAKMTTSPLDLFDPNVISLFYTAVLENDDDPCVNKYSQGIGVYDKYCDALDENDLRDVVGSADFNIDICHSFTDELVSFRNIPETFDPSFVTIFNITEASHKDSNFICGARVLDMISKDPLAEPKLCKPGKKCKKKKKDKKKSKKKKNKGKM